METRALSEYVVACPLCGAVSPDLVVDDRAGAWLCSCGSGGDLFDYTMKEHDISFAEALKMLGGIANIGVDEA